MLSRVTRSLMIFVICVLFSTSVFAQMIIGKPAALTRIEPGLENAVKWKWRVVPSDEKHWGLEIHSDTITASGCHPDSSTRDSAHFLRGETWRCSYSHREKIWHDGCPTQNVQRTANR